MRPTYTALARMRAPGAHFARWLATTAAVTIALLASAPPPLVGQDVEEILSYDVVVDVGPSSMLTVHETITVRALGRVIRRGIFRDFPTSFPRKTGLGRIEAPFQVRAVLLDGEPAPYDLSSIGTGFGRGGIRIRIGDPDVFLEPGVYRYEIEYETARWVHFGEEHDELYWNATGNGWGFPIRSATALVRVPGLTAAPAMDAWIGPEGSVEPASGAWDPALGVRFESPRALAPTEGLTFSVRFPKGLVAPPSAEQAAQWFRLDWGGYVDAGYIVLLVIAVYLLMWYRVGRDPAPGPTVVQYEPPDGFSPAALGYLRERGYEHSQFAATLVSMATKGALRIEKSGSTWTLHEDSQTSTLAPEEQRVFAELFGRGDKLALKQKNHETLRGAIKVLKRTLSAALEREYFVNNRGWFTVGLAVSLVGFAALAWRWRYGIEPPAWFLMIWLTFWSAGVVTMLWRALGDISIARRGGSVGHWASGLGMGCFSLPFIGAWVFVAWMLLSMVPTHLVLAAVAIGTANVAFYHLLERPTLKGRGVLNRLDGFEAFLSATDEDRLDRAMEADPTLFERFLPHAIALKLENAWARRFEWVLDPKGEMGSPHTFAWYDGGSAAMDATSFSSALGSTLTSTLSSSSSPPSSGGSGGGGGGSSGGGGGGGGGGGW